MKRCLLNILKVSLSKGKYEIKFYESLYSGLTICSNRLKSATKLKISRYLEKERKFSQRAALLL